MRKSVKIICIALCAAVLIGLGLYFIPWSTHVDQEMHAAVLSEDGAVLYKTEIKLSGTKKEYLFKKDTSEGTIEFLTVHADKNRRYQNWLIDRPFLDDPEKNPYIYGAYTVYNAALNSFMGGYYNLSFEKDVLILTNFGPEGKYLVASTDPDFDPLELLDTWKKESKVKSNI